MKGYLYLNLIEIIVLFAILIITVTSYYSTKNRNVLFGALAFLMFLLACAAVFIRNLVDLHGFMRVLFYFFDFGYLAGMIILLGVYRK